MFTGMTAVPPVSVRLSKAEVAEIDRLAKSGKATRSDVVRLVMAGAIRVRAERRLLSRLGPREQAIAARLAPEQAVDFARRRLARKGQSMSQAEGIPRSDVVAALLDVFKIDPSAADAADRLLDAVEGLPAKDAPAALRAVLAAVGVEVPK